MWTLVRQHLVVKIAIVVVATLGLGFAVPAILNAKLQLTEMERSGRESAQNVAQGLSAGVRTAMLSGNGITARTMVGDARDRLSTAQIRIYAPNGEEVFGVHAPVPVPDQLPSHVREVLADGAMHMRDEATAALPIENEARCRSCHPDGELRGVLTLGTDGAAVRLSSGDETLDVITDVAESAFVQIMTAEKEVLLDAYFEELAGAVDGIEGVSVLDPDGDPSYGPDLDVPSAQVRAAFEAKAPQTVQVEGARLRIHPLPNAPQCHACHDAQDVWRGAVVTKVDALPNPRETVVGATDISLRHVMLSGLGRMIARFLDEVAATGAVSTLTLHDGQGRLFRDAFAQPDPPVSVRSVLSSGQAHSALVEGDASEAFVFVAPLTNDPECIQCHGTDHDLRGAIAVTLDTTEAAQGRQRLVFIGAAFAVVTIGVTLALLYFGLKLLVVRPVSEMGSVADLVSEGRLDARVTVRSQDEVGRLGEQLNHMIGEVRKKLELSKFVSKATVGSVDAAESSITRRGTRERVTVLFSDIRGFTAFSETVEPEEVVQMLNRYLDVQASVVEAHGGDIDKFVGDELMAVFRGPDMETRALWCAVEMVQAIHRLNGALPPGTPQLEVGLGVNVGDVVFGAMGARNRMDFTVIGDAVNLGARLCSAAQPGQVLVSRFVLDATGDVPGLDCRAMDAIEVKGKRDPVEVFDVSRV
ncbi:MAG: adenylate/guanylate cyclase domain-containing protein [Nannocystaceae bacterium]|nr:HAMP domain-containing protein [bacterium]